MFLVWMHFAFLYVLGCLSSDLTLPIKPYLSIKLTLFAVRFLLVQDYMSQEVLLGEDVV